MRVANDVKGSDDNTFALDKGANYQLLESEEELADYDSDSTALAEEGDQEEEEGYDSDDTAFDYEDCQISKSWPQMDILTELEPGGDWNSTEATTVGERW